eukprot:92384-Hanusia_phi.AAC.1
MIPGDGSSPIGGPIARRRQPGTAAGPGYRARPETQTRGPRLTVAARASDDVGHAGYGTVPPPGTACHGVPYPGRRAHAMP